VIDGNNLIGHEKGLSLADDRSRETLVRALCALQRRTKKGIAVVFDGAPAAAAAASELGGVKVLYAGTGRSAMSADDRILRMVEEANRPSDLTVVTSDSALGNRARRLGAAVLPCHKFRPLLRDSAAAEAGGPEKPSHVDVRDWAEWFGIDPDEQG
jgi:predicted RNA-binding protein with PIN domain